MAPHPLARPTSQPVLLLVGAAARGVLAAVVGLLVWSVLPIALGWQVTVVMSGSMEPRLRVGDVVVSRPVPSTRLQVGQVLLVDDPDHAGRLRLHRLAGLEADGRLVLRGDANPADDSSPVSTAAVHGVGALRIPLVGRPVQLARTGRLGELLAVAVALATVVAAALLRPPTPAPGEPRSRRRGGAHRRPRRQRVSVSRRSRRSAGVVAAVGALIGLVGTAPAEGVPFLAAARNPLSQWVAETYFTCQLAARGDTSRLTYPLNETGGTTAADTSGNTPITAAYSGTGVTYGVPGPCNGNSGIALNGTSGAVTSNGTAAAGSLSEVTFEMWFKTSGARGGSLMSFTTSLMPATTMAMAVTTTGTIRLGVSAGGTKAIETTAAYNNNQWHLAVGVVGAAGMALYVDTATPVTSTAATSASGVSGVPRIGYANHLSLGTGSFDYFQGSVAYASVYLSSLSPAKVPAHYRSAS